MEAFDPLPSLLANRNATIIDGGLSSELEQRGHSLSHELWTARLLIDNPQAIRTAHIAYANAGANILITSSYQATLEGFTRAGLSIANALQLIAKSVDLAQVSEEVGHSVLVAASIGPYGAALANGSEYTGDYARSVEELKQWHRPRIEALQETSADLLAIETVPSGTETVALTELLTEFKHVRAWISFCCRDSNHLADGTALSDALHLVAHHPQIVAVGINCVAPKETAAIVAQIRAVTNKPILAYPNSSQYNRETGGWEDPLTPQQFSNLAADWLDAGCQIIGGCCGTTSKYIAELALNHASQV